MQDNILLQRNETKNRRVEIIRLLIGILISGITLWLAFRSISWDALVEVMRKLSFSWVLLGAASIVLNNMGKAIRWRILMGDAGKTIRFLPILASLMIGQMINLIVPIRLGEITRAYQIGGLGPGVMYVLGSVLIEKILDMLGYALMFLLLLVSYPTPDWIDHSATGFIFTAVTITVILFILAFKNEFMTKQALRFLNKFPEKMRNKVSPWVISGLNSLTTLKNPFILIQVSIWNIVIWGTGVLTNQFIAYSLNLDLPWIASVIMLIVLQAGISIPSIPGRIGIIEILCIMVLEVFKIDKTTALGYGIILHLVILLPITLMGAILMAIPGIWVKTQEKPG